MSTLRVLLSIHHELDPDTGAPGATFALGESLRRLGHDVEYLSFDDMPVRLPERAASVAYPPFVAARLARRSRPGLDVIDASTGDAWLWAKLQRRARRGGRRPLLVCRSHGLEHLFHQATVARARRDGESLSRRYRLYWGGYRLWEVAQTLRLADVALFLNPTERAFAVEQLGVDPSRAQVVPNGLPDRFLETPLEPAPSDPAEPAHIAQVGGWRQLKGIDYSVDALTRILARHERETVSFIGTGAGPEEILPRFPPELRERVRVVPSFRRDDLPDLLRGHHIQLFPTLSEGFGLALLEAMACGLAPVASAVAGPSTLVEDGENGLAVPPADSAAIVAAVERLLGDRALLNRLQAEARKSAEPFALSRVTATTVALYEEALTRRREEEETG